MTIDQLTSLLLAGVLVELALILFAFFRLIRMRSARFLVAGIAGLVLAPMAVFSLVMAALVASAGLGEGWRWTRPGNRQDRGTIG